MKKAFCYLAFASLLIIGQGCTLPHFERATPVPDPLERLRVGNLRFAEHHARHPDQTPARLKETAVGQHPYAVIITCSDSRVSPEIIFDEGIGDLFVIRNAGNVVDDTDVLASVEYAVEHLGVGLVAVMGHEHCGAIQAMLQHHKAPGGEVPPQHVATLLKRIEHEPEEQVLLSEGAHRAEHLLHDCVVANVWHGVKSLSLALAGPANEHAPPVKVVGAVYDIQTGVVHFLDSPTTTR